MHQKSSEDISGCLGAVWAASRVVFTACLVVLFCSVCEKELEEGRGETEKRKEKKRSSWVVTVCSALPPRSPETSLEMEMEGCNIRVIIFGAPMASQRAAWGHRHPLPRVRKWAVPGKALSRRVGGRADSRGAAAAVFIRQLRRAQTARTQQRSSAPAATGQRHVATSFF